MVRLANTQARHTVVGGGVAMVTERGGGTLARFARGTKAHCAILVSNKGAVMRWEINEAIAVMEEGRGALCASNGDGGVA